MAKSEDAGRSTMVERVADIRGRIADIKAAPILSKAALFEAAVVDLLDVVENLALAVQGGDND